MRDKRGLRAAGNGDRTTAAPRCLHTPHNGKCAFPGSFSTVREPTPHTQRPGPLHVQRRPPRVRGADRRAAGAGLPRGAEGSVQRRASADRPAAMPSSPTRRGPGATSKSTASFGGRVNEAGLNSAPILTARRHARHWNRATRGGRVRSPSRNMSSRRRLRSSCRKRARDAAKPVGGTGWQPSSSGDNARGPGHPGETPPAQAWR